MGDLPKAVKDCNQAKANADFANLCADVEATRSRLAQRNADHASLIDAVVRAISEMGQGGEQGAALRALSEELRQYRDDADRRVTLRWQQVALDGFLRHLSAWLAHPTPGRVAMLQGAEERLAGLADVDPGLAEAIGLVGLTIYGEQGE